MPAAATYELAAPTQTTSGSAASVTFSSISGSFTDLILVATFSTSASENMYMRFNGDTATNYQGATYSSNNTTLAGNKYNNQSYMNPGWYTWPGGGTIQGLIICNIMSYANTSVFKSVIGRSGSNNGVEHTCNIWKSTAAITSILCYPSGAATFVNGSTFALYGIKAA